MKHMNKLGCLAFAVTAVTMAGLPVCGAEAKETGMYVALDAGVNLLNNIKVEGTSEEVDPGWRIGAELGYHLNKYASVGFETGFLYNQPKEHPDDEWLGQVPLLAKAVFRCENESKFVPYVGLGVGGAFTMAVDNTDSATDFVFAWQGEAGVRYKIGEHASVGIAYKYMGTSAQNYDFDGVGIKIGNVHNHMFGVSFNWSF